MSGHTAGVAALTIATRQADGTTISRRWLTCEHCAEGLAAQLGPPSDEVLITPDAAADIQAAFEAAPGVVRHGRSGQP